MPLDREKTRALIQHAADELRLFGQPVDCITLAVELERSGELSLVGGRSGLMSALAEGLQPDESWQP